MQRQDIWEREMHSQSIVGCWMSPYVDACACVLLVVYVSWFSHRTFHGPVTMPDAFLCTRTYCGWECYMTLVAVHNHYDQSFDVSTLTIIAMATLFLQFQLHPICMAIMNSLVAKTCYKFFKSNGCYQTGVQG